jgi:uncharacterized protein YmfQ (DUF2313 family)
VELIPRGPGLVLEELLALLPPGWAWPREAGSTLGGTLAAPAAVLADLERGMADLLAEADPAQAGVLLEEWEAAYGLPDPCVGEGATVQERRAALLARIRGLGGSSPAFFIALAATLGFSPVTIEEFRPFRADAGRAGQPLNNSPWMFTWRVHAPVQTILYFRAGVSAAGEPLSRASNALLECVLARLKPAHTVLQFAYDIPVSGGPPPGGPFRVTEGGDRRVTEAGDPRVME